MLAGTSLAPTDIVAIAPPDLVELTVEKIAINAVMAGCLPEYLPWVIAALQAVCTDEFNMHGVLATTMPVGPVIVCSGPGSRAIGMNSGVNVLGQGNRANMTIGRAVQLTIRNVGGGRPGEIDRAAHGMPGKLSFCFAEDEIGSPWTSLAIARGVSPETDAVTVFAGEGPRCVTDQLARTPEHLVASLAATLLTVEHPKLPLAYDAMLVVGPEHARVFGDAGWSRERVLEELHARLQLKHTAYCSFMQEVVLDCSPKSLAVGPVALLAPNPSRNSSLMWVHDENNDDDHQYSTICARPNKRTKSVAAPNSCATKFAQRPHCWSA